MESVQGPFRRPKSGGIFSASFCHLSSEVAWQVAVEQSDRRDSGHCALDAGGPARSRNFRWQLCLSPAAVAFYNPSNTALEAVVSLIRHPGAQPTLKNGCTFRQRVREYRSRFCNSQEHCMKKLVLASVMALASISLVTAPTLRAQDIGTRSKSRTRPNSMPINKPAPRAIPAPKHRAWRAF